MLNQEQLSFAVDCMAEWARICEDAGRSTRSVDIDHSALLGYLLRGNRPFKKPPPRRYSCPDYELAEGKEVYIGELWESPIPDPLLGKPIVIDQSRSWNWHDKEKGILVHKDGDLYKFREGTAEEIIDRCILSKTYSREKAIADQQKTMDENKVKGVLTGFLQRCDGEAPRKKRRRE